MHSDTKETRYQGENAPPTASIENDYFSEKKFEIFWKKARLKQILPKESQFSSKPKGGILKTMLWIFIFFCDNTQRFRSGMIGALTCSAASCM